MTTDMAQKSAEFVSDNLRGVRDAISVGRVFGDAYEIDGVTVIPVARVTGGGGGGAGDDAEKGGGFGSGFGLGVSPVGVYEVSEGDVSWSPALDINRAVKGAQILVGIIAVCFALVLRQRTG